MYLLELSFCHKLKFSFSISLQPNPRPLIFQTMNPVDQTIFIIKQDIRIYVPYSRPNGWTDWAEILWGHSGMAGG